MTSRRKSSIFIAFDWVGAAYGIIMCAQVKLMPRKPPNKPYYKPRLNIGDGGIGEAKLITGGSSGIGIGIGT